MSQLTAGYGELVAVLRGSLIAELIGVWGSLGSYRDRDVDRFVNYASPLVRAGQSEIATLTQAYVSALAAEAGQRAVAGELGAMTDLRGIPTEDVYRRPAVTLYSGLADGASFDDALKKSTKRLTSLVGTDLQMSKVRSAQQAMNRTGVDSWRRVTKGTHTCALCLVASTQRYHRRDLAPIHPGCDCDVEPLFGHDPAEIVIDQDLLDRIHDAVDEAGFDVDLSARATDYRKLLLVEEHGEYGPTLSFKEHRFTGVKDLGLVP